jgi:hypothetical protein
VSSSHALRTLWLYLPCFVSATSRLDMRPVLWSYTANCVIPRSPPNELGDHAEKTTRRCDSGYCGTIYAATGMIGNRMMGLHSPWFCASVVGKIKKRKTRTSSRTTGMMSEDKVPDVRTVMRWPGGQQLTVHKRLRRYLGTTGCMFGSLFSVVAVVTLGVPSFLTFSCISTKLHVHPSCTVKVR